jgi:hypothetical protein
MMKSLKNKNRKADFRGITLRVFTIVLVLCAVILVGSGCKSWGYPGETKAEAKRRHERVLRLNQQDMQADIDKVLMLDRPSNLTDKRLP